MTGGSLSDALRRPKDFSVRRSLEIEVDTARGLAYMHNKKPQGILVQLHNMADRFYPRESIPDQANAWWGEKCYAEGVEDIMVKSDPSKSIGTCSVKQLLWELKLAATSICSAMVLISLLVLVLFSSAIILSAALVLLFIALVLTLVLALASGLVCLWKRGREERSE